MNENLKEIAIKAQVEHCISHVRLQEFAELIVGHATECVRDVLRDENSDLTYAAAAQVQNRIKEFFGVEE